ncbi:hypothetical protein QQM79_17850 [Marinobacteraceae bacterium S3BR75-40.1]
MRGVEPMTLSQGERPAAAHGWGFPISTGLLDQARQAAREARHLDTAGLPEWHKRAFEVASQLIFAGVSSYYEASLDSTLPPLADGVAPGDAVQTIGLGLTFWAGKVLQGRSVQELQDLARYLDRSLVDPCGDQPALIVFPLDDATVQQIRSLAERVKQSSDLEACRAMIRATVIEIGVATVEAYYHEVGDEVDDPAHYRQVIRYGKLEAERTLTEILDQLLPTFPHDHLVHFAHYVEAMVRHAEEGGRG